MGGISFAYTNPEQVVTGTYAGVDIIILAVKPDAASAAQTWAAACGLVDTFKEAGSEAQALFIDIARAEVRHGYITRMED